MIRRSRSSSCALEAGNTTAVDWSAFKDQMRPASISTEAWEPLWANFLSEVGNTWGGYVSMLTANASYLGRLGLQVKDIGQLLAFEFAQADSINVVRYLAASTDADGEAPGQNISFRRMFPQSITGRYRLGAFGRGWFHNWDASLQAVSDGTVTVMEPNGVRRVYQPDSRPGGAYFPMEGDHAVLTKLGDGTYTLRESNGFLRAFRTDGKFDYTEDTNGNRRHHYWIHRRKVIKPITFLRAVATDCLQRGWENRQGHGPQQPRDILRLRCGRPTPDCGNLFRRLHRKLYLQHRRRNRQGTCLDGDRIPKAAAASTFPMTRTADWPARRGTGAPRPSISLTVRQDWCKLPTHSATAQNITSTTTGCFLRPRTPRADQ